MLLESVQPETESVGVKGINTLSRVAFAASRSKMEKLLPEEGGK